MVIVKPDGPHAIEVRSDVFGEFVQVELPFSLMEPDEAEAYARRLTAAALICRQRRERPETRPLPLSEALCLESPSGASAEMQTRRPGTDTRQDGDTFVIGVGGAS